MKSIKNLLLFSFIVGMFSIPVSASSIEEKVYCENEFTSGVTVFNNTTSLSTEDIHEISNMASISWVSPNGNTEPIDSIITINEVTPFSNDESIVYSVELSANVQHHSQESYMLENGSDKINSNYVNADIYLKMYWEKLQPIYFSNVNSFNLIQGNFTLDSGRQLSSSITYGDYSNITTPRTTKNITGQYSIYQPVNTIVKTPFVSYKCTFHGISDSLQVTLIGWS